MKPFRWNREKNETVKAERSISFEEIVLAIEADGLLDVLQHQNAEKYPNQLVFVVTFESYPNSLLVKTPPFRADGAPPRPEGRGFESAVWEGCTPLPN